MFESVRRWLQTVVNESREERRPAEVNALAVKMSEALENPDTIKHFVKGDKVLREGDPGKAMYFIEQGSVQAMGAKNKRVYNKLRPGSNFGEWALITGDFRTCDIVACSDTILRELTKIRFDEVIGSFPDGEFGQVFKSFAVKRQEDRIRKASMDLRAHLSKHFLGQDGYLAQVKGLVGPMAEYNGCVARPQPVMDELDVDGSPMYQLFIKKRPEENGFWLKVPERRLEPAVEYQKAAALQRKNQTNRQNKRESAKHGLQQVTAMVRNAICACQKEYGGSMEKVFERFDINGDGEMDKKELMQGCWSIGVDITREQTNMIWPLFDNDGSGAVDVDEFVIWMAKSGSKHGAAAFAVTQATQHAVALEQSARQRQNRIRMKTTGIAQASETLAESAVRLKLAAEEYSESNGDLYVQLDRDNAGQVNKNDWVMGMEKCCHISIPLKEVDIMFALITGDTTSKNAVMTCEDWKKFVAPDKNAYTNLKNAFPRLKPAFDEYMASMHDGREKLPQMASSGEKRSPVRRKSIKDAANQRKMLATLQRCESRRGALERLKHKANKSTYVRIRNEMHELDEAVRSIKAYMEDQERPASGRKREPPSQFSQLTLKVDLPVLKTSWSASSGLGNRPLSSFRRREEYMKSSPKLFRSKRSKKSRPQSSRTPRNTDVLAAYQKLVTSPWRQ